MQNTHHSSLNINRPVIAVIGDAWIERDDPREAFAFSLGKLLIDSGWRVQTGGMGGVMEATCKGARSSSHWREGDIIGILPGVSHADANPFCDIIIPTGLGHGRNMLVVQASAVVAIGGGPGTLSEISFAWLTNRLIIAMRGAGWAGSLADKHLDTRRTRLPQIPDDKVYGVNSPEEAIAIIHNLHQLYAKNHALCSPQKIST